MFPLESQEHPLSGRVRLFILTKGQLQRVLLIRQEKSRAKSLMGSAMSLCAGSLHCPLTLQGLDTAGRQSG